MEWDRNNIIFKHIAKAVFGGSPTTEHANEKAFATVKDKCRQSKVNVMSPTTMWMYASLNPHLRAGGMPMIETTEADYLALADPEVRKQLLNSMLKSLNPKSPVEVPESIPRPEQLTSKWKPAKHDANRDAAAASVFIVMDADNEFAHAPHVWMGALT